MAKVIIFNAPPNTGKDYFSDRMIRDFNRSKTQYRIPEIQKNFYHLEFKDKIFKLVKLLYAIDDEVWDELYLRKNKDTPTELLNGLSPRQAMIHVSEDIVKPNFGKSYFGDDLVKQISKDYNGVYFISDGGFLDEILPLINDENIDLYVFKLEDGINTFEKYHDSRGYLDLSDYPEVWCSKFFNDRTERAVDQLFRLIAKIL